MTFLIIDQVDGEPTEADLTQLPTGMLLYFTSDPDVQAELKRRIKSGELRASVALHLPGQHDQSTHGRSRFVKSWKPLDHDKAIKRLAKERNFVSPQQQYFEDRYAGTEFYELPGEHTIGVDNPDLIDPAKLEVVKSRLALLVHSYPPPHPLRVMITNYGFTPGEKYHSYAGFALIGEGRISLNEDRLGRDRPTNLETAWSISGTVTHEFGHTITPPIRRVGDTYLPDAKVLDTWWDNKDELTEYGKTNAHEGFAEAFKEWDLSRGKTTNQAVRNYAEIFNWRKDYA